MKRRLLAAVAVSAMCMGQSQANAQDIAQQDSLGLYVSVFAGHSDARKLHFKWLNDTSGSSFRTSVDLKSGYLLGGAVGLQVGDVVRGEIEFSQSQLAGNNMRKVDGNGVAGKTTLDGHMTATFLLSNLWVDLKTDSPFTPYAGGGIGLGWIDPDFNGSFLANSFGGNKGTDLAYQLGVGVKYAVSDDISVDLGYRYKAIPDLELKFIGAVHDRTDGDFASHNVQLGLSYRF